MLMVFEDLHKAVTKINYDLQGFLAFRGVTVVHALLKNSFTAFTDLFQNTFKPLTLTHVVPSPFT